jgi:hypothetical protein
VPDSNHNQASFQIFKLVFLQVLNQPDFDFGSSCSLLADCLGELLAWSNAHPSHVPITIVFHGGEVPRRSASTPQALTLTLTRPRIRALIRGGR